jgi:hypothetical protein
MVMVIITRNGVIFDFQMNNIYLETRVSLWFDLWSSHLCFEVQVDFYRMIYK